MQSDKMISHAFISKKLFVKKSKITGKGIYAAKDIKKNELIFVVKGIILKFEPEDDSWSVPHAISYAKDRWLNPYHNNPLRYTNHSCDANAIITDGLKVIALKKIMKGSEITVDYSLTEIDPEWSGLNCRCRAKDCRNKIRDVRTIPKKTFRKYEKYLRKFVVDEYYS